MEISKGLQEEILAVQNKLKNAIRDHQICVGKLKDDPNNTDILGQIQEIHLRIVSLGRCQKQVVQRLRKEVETFKAQNVNGAKVSIASLLGLNNNNHITNNNEEKHERKTAPDVVSTKPSKEDYEEIVRNGDVPSPAQDIEPPKERSVSVETISGEDDVIEVSMDENSNEKQEDLEKQRKTEDDEKVNFLSCLGLITTLRYAELQNKRAERKRRSTANPQFVYSSLEMPTKRKRHSYLQSTGCAPQTRQTTARLNGPSPPPSKVSPPKAVSPPTRTVTKSLIPVQKSTTRPNILRNVTDSKVYVSKAKTESEACQVQLPTPSVKPIATQSVNSKTVHIPGLPSSLTIERIESDSVVCINCRNPGTLTVCENCSASYHVSCHSISPPPPRTCPKCALVNEEEEEGRLRFRKDEELEEKERERYELRERNSELRLQVYELEKRSQLLGQSLQLQQRTRQELLGKQEKTQRSIKRLVDFIKLMQLRRDTQSPPRSASVNSHPRPSSSRSPQTASPPQTSAKPTQAAPPAQSIVNSQRTLCPIPPSSLISCPDPASPTSIQSHPKCPTPTSYLPITPSQKSTNHTSLSRKSQSQSDGMAVSVLEIKPNAPSFPQSTITNCQPRQVTMLAFSPRSPSPIQPCSSTNTSPVATVKNQNAPCPRSIASSTQKSCVFQPSVNWSNQPSTGGSLVESSSRGPNSVSTSCEQQEPRKSSYQPTILQSPTNSCKSQSQQQAQKRQRSSAIVLSTGQEAAVYSTHCSQAITSPISSPIILASREVQTPRAQSTMTQTPTNSCIIKTNNWSQQAHNQTSLQSRYSAEPSQSSSGT